MGLHWAAPALQQLIPEELWANIRTAQVDPCTPTKEHESIRFIHGRTGDMMGKVDVNHLYRLRRHKICALLMQGLKVQCGKVIAKITYSDDGKHITAHFADGTQDTGNLLVGSDGPHSTVRTLLVGPETAQATPIDFATTMCFSNYPRDRALKLRSAPNHPLFQCSPHPNGYFAWLGLQDASDPDRPESWTFVNYISFPEPRHTTNDKTTAQHVAHQKEIAKQYADPFKSAYEWMPDDSSTAWYGKLRHWDPSIPEHKWDTHGGRVTLAGDAAHPMTFQRGQGLNHAITDSLHLCETIKNFWAGSADLAPGEKATAIAAYEHEMVQRSGEEIRRGEQNSKMLHDWDKVLQAPAMRGWGKRL